MIVKTQISLKSWKADAAMNIKINYTAFLVNDWEMIVEKHLFHMCKSGLYSNCNTFNIFAYPKTDKLIRLVEKYKMAQKTHIYFFDENMYEFPAIEDLINNPDDINLYFHTKGVSLKGSPMSYVPSLMWNDYMTYFNISHWIDNIKLLHGNVCSGVEFGKTSDNPAKYLYAGNFWWATREHLNLVKMCPRYTEFHEHKNRYLCETIIEGAPGDFYELYNSCTDTPKSGFLYFNPFVGYRFSVSNIKKYEIK